jgi:hypothetical protein
MMGRLDFVGRKAFVNNLRIKDNMLSSKLPPLLRKTLAPTKAVRGVRGFEQNRFGTIRRKTIKLLKTRNLKLTVGGNFYGRCQAFV